ncbi:glycoside hydrolase family 10 protein [Haploplasma axanthum]|uniref:Uncharacterized protein conserved in bacteria n=1 Tax=Haploplasma axanthum TaxID=29552 RepID=A0A449BCV5_HAPAX|nr:family 10 glycosylhydrolase [Haploplasma axanthum]VEU80291.1 Uncharacterized protein conserved in bacteria [Haploplasma axanthum]
MKKISKLIMVFMVLVMLTSILSLNIHANENMIQLEIGTSKITYADNTPVMVPNNYIEKDKEFRGVWIATVWNIDMPATAKDIELYKAAYREKLDLALSYNFNAILFQVRGMNDIYYESEYAAFSKSLTGNEGENPGWDVMQFLIDETHSRGMEFHAWMNPYRVVSSGEFNPSLLHQDNFARQRPDLVIKSGDAHILNPGEPEVQEYIKDVVSELFVKYPSVDGIHFDDYFYFGGNAEDQLTYTKYGSQYLTIQDFRRDSINKMIKSIYEEVKNFNLINSKNAKFGISPSGIYKNKTASQPDGSNTGGQEHYNSHFIDTKKWIEEGWLDYVTPQIYWQFSNTLAPYAEVVKWWVDAVKDTNVDLIIGHSVSEGTWNSYERAAQVLFNSQFEEIKGSIFYSLRNIDSIGRFEYIKNNFWKNSIPTNYANSNLDVPNYQVIGEKNEDGTYKTSVLIEFSSNYEIEYKIGNGNWQVYNSQIFLDHHGEESIYYRAKDNENTSVVRRIAIVINKNNNNLPVIIVNGEKEGNDYVGEVEIVITAEPNSQIEYYIMRGLGSVAEYIPYTGPIKSNVVYNHRVFARTIEGNTPSAEVIKEFKIIAKSYDAPTIIVTGDGIDPNYTNARITFESDALEIQYRINGGTWKTYVNGIDIVNKGEYLIEVRNNDGKKEVVSKRIYIDEAELDDVNIIIEGVFNNNKYTSYTEVSFSEVNSPNVVMFRYNYSNNWSNWMEYKEKIVAKKNGLYFFEFYVLNKNNNQKTETMEEYFRVEVEYDLLVDKVIRNDIELKKINGESILLPTDYIEKDKQIRAIWFSTVSNIDLPRMGTDSVDEYKNRIIASFDRIKETNLNTIFFQVRPMNDALYYSEYAPYSRYITGVEGKNPGFDILEFVIKIAHERGIELHAWLNPYRVSNGSGSIAAQLASLHDKNFAKQNPDLVLADSKGQLILNPGEPKVQEYLDNVIKEIVTKYNVDGIHFDDYFYSYSGTPEENDRQTYINNRTNNESLGDWRRRNVNTVVRDVSNIIKEQNTLLNKKIKFGISPFGIWRNKSNDPNGSPTNGLQSYDSQYADTKKWIEEGWLDYVTPQLYWSFDTKAAPFADLVDWWYELTEKNNVGLIIGQGLYRLDSSEAAFWNYENEMIEQLRFLSSYENLLGTSFFTYTTITKTNVKGITTTLDFLKNYYWKTTADFPWETNISTIDSNKNNKKILIISIAGGVFILAITTITIILVRVKRKENV